MDPTETRAGELYKCITAIKTRTMSRQFNFLKSNLGSLNLKEVSVLMLIGERGTSNMRSIAASMNMALSTATSVIDRMVKGQLVKRERTDNDRRVVLVSLTGKGKELTAMMQEESISIYAAMLRRLNENEQSTLIELFTKMAPAQDGSINGIQE